MDVLASPPVGRAPGRARGPEPGSRRGGGRRRALAGGARLCAVAGHPIGHSRSPALFALLFDHYGLPYAYTWIDAADPVAVLGLAARLDLRGLSVTLPLKEEMLPYR